MARSLLIWMSCFALIVLGVSGAHDHLSMPAVYHHHHDEGLDDHHPAASISLFLEIDADHIHAHQDEGDVDVDPPDKAFGKLSPMQWAAAFSIAMLMIAFLCPPPLQLSASPPLRPPKTRARPHLFPPSQAPPAAA